MKFKKTLISILYPALICMLAFSFSSCHKRIILEEDYSDFRRVIGPKGGIINFYEYNPQDSIPEIIVSMEFPKNALDSVVVFNMYEFYDQPTYIDLFYMDMEQNSYFLYFVPFYESGGYNEHNQGDIDRHISINFDLPVTVTYNMNFYFIENNAKLYRIKIPAENEWGEENNVWVNYNYQGYPNGYDDIDLIYLINGRWTETMDWGVGELSLTNWEEVTDYFYNGTDRTVTFDIYNTDYMYVMAYYFGL